MWFAMMYTFGKIGPFLSGFSMFAIILYFVTSSDSGSLIIDIISANGDQVTFGLGYDSIEIRTLANKFK